MAEAAQTLPRFVFDDHGQHLIYLDDSIPTRDKHLIGGLQIQILQGLEQEPEQFTHQAMS